MVKEFFRSFRKRLEGSGEVMEGEEHYVELSAGHDRHFDSKVIVRQFHLEDFTDVKPIVDSLREGYTIALVDIAPLKEKDIVELKRSINKLKKTIDAIDGDIAGFGDDYLIAAPSFAQIYRAPPTPKADDME